MKNNLSSEAKCFPIKFNKKILLLCIGVFLLCTAGIVVTVFRIVKNGGLHGFTDFLKFPFLIAVCVFCIVLIACLLAKSQYIVDNGYIVTQFGFVKSKYALKEITSISLDRTEHKLTVNAGESFMVLSVSPDWQEDFATAIIKANPDIEFSYTLTEVPKDGENKDEPKDNEKR